ncbi:6,7-dimethyl-8-ribityllumazine synthase [Vibrio owensii]|uniref:hypothetical protein n=1 Tax=Vibrio owensii TaxID=696485 RepID=UPI0003A0187C|nr:hypothetical protein [Vibrio owensii]SUP41641.1 6,7-dimethyl-8-ribityllumazine synthase [Vibrio owensii]
MRKSLLATIVFSSLSVNAYAVQVDTREANRQTSILIDQQLSASQAMYVASLNARNQQMELSEFATEDATDESSWDSAGAIAGGLLVGAVGSISTGGSSSDPASPMKPISVTPNNPIETEIGNPNMEYDYAWNDQTLIITEKGTDVWVATGTLEKTNTGVELVIKHSTGEVVRIPLENGKPVIKPGTPSNPIEGEVGNPNMEYDYAWHDQTLVITEKDTDVWVATGTIEKTNSGVELVIKHSTGEVVRIPLENGKPVIKPGTPSNPIEGEVGNPNMEYNYAWHDQTLVITEKGTDVWVATGTLEKTNSGVELVIKHSTGEVVRIPLENGKPVIKPGTPSNPIEGEVGNPNMEYDYAWHDQTLIITEKGTDVWVATGTLEKTNSGVELVIKHSTGEVVRIPLENGKPVIKPGTPSNPIEGEVGNPNVEYDYTWNDQTLVITEKGTDVWVATGTIEETTAGFELVIKHSTGEVVRIPLENGKPVIKPGTPSNPIEGEVGNPNMEYDYAWHDQTLVITEKGTDVWVATGTIEETTAGFELVIKHSTGEVVRIPLENGKPVIKPSTPSNPIESEVGNPNMEYDYAWHDQTLIITEKGNDNWVATGTIEPNNTDSGFDLVIKHNTGEEVRIPLENGKPVFKPTGNNEFDAYQITEKVNASDFDIQNVKDRFNALSAEQRKKIRQFVNTRK